MVDNFRVKWVNSNLNIGREFGLYVLVGYVDRFIKIVVISFF